MKVGKPKSKRVPVRLRHKIQKASAAKQRKSRKEEKTNPQWRSRLKKDPGIPNLFPYKAKLLAEIEESKRRKEEEQMQRREVAKARRQGKAVEAQASSAGQTVADEAPLDQDDDDFSGVSVENDSDEDEEMEDVKDPMAALIASAQAMAQNYEALDGGAQTEDSDETGDEGQLDTLAVSDKVAKGSSKALPKRALEDPVKAVTLLMKQMENTPSGVQTLLDHYQIPPLVTAGSDLATRTLVEVARKRGRLGRGGVPNLHAAALLVLSDLHEQRLRLPAMQTATSKTAKGEVKIVKTMAAPFRLEGLWGDSIAEKASSTEMAVDV